MSDATPMNDDDLRMFANAMLFSHNPEYQEDNPYGRCALCHYTRHPCDVYDLAAAVIGLLDLQEATKKSWRQRMDFGVVPRQKVQSLLDSDADISLYDAEREVEREE